MTPRHTPSAEAGERLYIGAKAAQSMPRGREWWAQMTEEQRAPWRALAAELRAEALREAVAVAEAVRDSDRRGEDAAKGRLAEMHAREQAGDLPLTASLVSGPEYNLMHHRSAAYGAQSVADRLRALAGDGGEG